MELQDLGSSEGSPGAVPPDENVRRIAPRVRMHPRRDARVQPAAISKPRVATIDPGTTKVRSRDESAVTSKASIAEASTSALQARGPEITSVVR